MVPVPAPAEVITISVSANPLGNSLDANVRESEPLLDVSPEDTSVAVMVIMGPVVSFVHEN